MYLLFAGYDYYPKGGLEDFIGEYLDIDAAIVGYDQFCSLPHDGTGGNPWGHIVEKDSLKVVRYTGVEYTADGRITVWKDDDNWSMYV